VCYLHCMGRFRSLVLLPLCCYALFAHAQQGGDLQAQILYAFHAEDTNQLTTLVQTLSTEGQAAETDAALRYHLAHAQYRLGLLLGERRRHDAEAAFADCVDQLKVILEQTAQSVESLALQSACYSDLARFRRLQAALLRSRASERLSAAVKFAPRNPRVLFLSAMEGLARAKSGTVENAQAFAQLQLAAQLFEQSSATLIDVPGWGHAEAYLALGRELQSRGDILGARNWIEKSLIAAPDFKAAQRQLGTLARH
jgi:tetratricopeptide (TPR) repeat protein